MIKYYNKSDTNNIIIIDNDIPQDLHAILQTILSAKSIKIIIKIRVQNRLKKKK